MGAVLTGHTRIVSYAEKSYEKSKSGKVLYRR